MTHIIKRKGHRQEFDERKLYASVYASCLSYHSAEEEAQATANLVTREIKKWIFDKGEVSSRDIHEKVEKELKHLNKDAAFMYDTHKDIS